MRRLIFINRFFFPDHSATSQILSDLAFHLAGTGREVHVVTSTQIYDDPKASLPDYEIIHDVRVHRVSSTQFGRAALLGRSIDYFSFYWSVWRRLIAIARARRYSCRKNRSRRWCPSWLWRPRAVRAHGWSIGCKMSTRNSPWSWAYPSFAAPSPPA